MEKITQKEFNSYKRSDNGILYLPSGDYSLISSFGKWCSFGKRCSFGKECSFGELCSFGKGCSFGKECSFGKGCSFGEWCSFGKLCSFGKRCSFGELCSFGKGCKATSPLWSFQYEPPFKTKGKILPPITCREYWEERLGMKLSGCYEKIGKRIKPKLKKLLKLDKWTKCERRILESWL